MRKVLLVLSIAVLMAIVLAVNENASEKAQENSAEKLTKACENYERILDDFFAQAQTLLGDAISEQDVTDIKSGMIPTLISKLCKDVYEPCKED